MADIRQTNPNSPNQDDKAKSKVTTHSHESGSAIPMDIKIQLFLMKNKWIFSLVAGMIVISFLAYEGYQFIQKKKVENMQKAYLEEEAEAFLKEYPDQPLAALKILSKADEAYEKGDFSKSFDYYSQALIALQGTSFKYRAQLGMAASLIQNEQKAEGQKILKTIAEDSTFPDTFRAEAFYLLAILELEANRVKEADYCVKSIQSLPFAGIWLNKVELLEEFNSGLRDMR